MLLRTRHVGLAAVLIFLTYTAWLVLGRSTTDDVGVVDNLASMAVSLFPLTFAVLAARAQRGRTRAAWIVLAVGLLCWTVGDVIWAFREITGQDTGQVSVADVFYLSFSALAAVALLLFWKRRGLRSQGRILLDGLIVAGSLFAASWAMGMNRLYQADSSSRAEFVVSMAYPISDLVVVTVATLVMISASQGQRRFLGLVTLGLTAAAVTDSAYAYLAVRDEYASGNLIDVGWVAAMLLIGVAAAAGRTAVDDEHAPDELPGWASVWLPFLPLMLAAGALAVAPISSSTSRPVLVVGAMLIVAVLLRQYLAVDQNRRLLAAVADQALHDPLTGLANRTLVADRLERALAAQGPGRTAVGVIALDLDDFKLINDTLGHAAGDELLRATGQRVLACVRSGDTVARLGGDEFAAVVSAEAPLLEAIADRVVEAFNQPVVVEGHELLMRPSVGLAIAPPGADVPAGELIRRADVAMYAAKRSRTAKVRVYSEDMARLESREETAIRLSRGRPAADAAAAVKLFGELRRAIDAHQLTLVYQPKMDLQTRAIVGFEALLRWPHPERGVLGPDEFLPLVRQHSLTAVVTELVLEVALDDAQAWHREGLQVPVAVNLFPSSLALPDLAQQIDLALARRGLTPSALTVEITEDLVLGDIGLARQVLLLLRERGIRVAIDDFGSGYSALWYLRDLPVDEVKLDRNFIAPISADHRAAAVVRAVLDLARVLNIKTVAEGVEDDATLEVLRRYGCDMVQGYYFSPPITAAEVLGLAHGLGSPTSPSAPVVSAGP